MSDDTDLPVAGDRGTRLYVRGPLRIDDGALKPAALVKTADFSLLRADFDGEEVVFSPWLSLRLADSHRIVSWAAYQPASSDEPEEGAAYPDVAWRWLEWNRSQDADRFWAAPDKAAYLRGDAQFDSRIRFGRLAELPLLAEGVREGIEVLAGGVVVHGTDRPDLSYQRLFVSVADERMVMDLVYSPWATRCGEIESWAQRWSTLIETLDDEGTVVPDGPIRVMYENSYEELIARTHRSARPAVDS
jgi:hypothetical protein